MPEGRCQNRGERHRGAAEFALQQREVEVVEPAAADLFRQVGGVEAERHHLALDLLADLGRTCPSRSTSAS
jgi:hypothetical protein